VKIVFLLTQDLESPSGLGRYAPLARELAALGHRVSVYALHPNYEQHAPKDSVQGNLRVVYVAPMHVRKGENLKTYYSPFRLGLVVLRATWMLTRAALSEWPDLIWMGKPHPMNGIAGVLARLRWGCRLFLDCDDDEAGSGNFQAGWQRSLVGWFEARLPRSAEWVTTNTHFTLEKMVGRGIPREKLYYLPNGVDLARFQPPPGEAEIDALKTRLGWQGKKVISYIGSMSLANHAVDLLVEAFEVVRQAEREARLLLVGSGEDFQRLREDVSARGLDDVVAFTGRIPPDQVSLYYRISQVTVDPVYNNDAARGRSPLKMFEAWACGVPFVTSAVGDRAELAGDPPAALLVQPGDARGLAEGIRALLGDEIEQRVLRDRGNDRLAEFVWSSLAHEANTQLLGDAAD
jgi:glycosyltransferase involved in cell wall biosynthesis